MLVNRNLANAGKEDFPDDNLAWVAQKPERLTRLRNILTVPQVALLIDQYEEDWTRLWCVLIRGKAKLIPMSGHKERAWALRKLRAKYPQYARRMLPNDAPIIQIKPNRTAFWAAL
jgi:PPOX class probable F420-dependent enzyme